MNYQTNLLKTSAWVGFFLWAFVGTGCQKDEGSQTQTATGFATNLECGKLPMQICNEGLSFAHIGDSLPALSFTNVETTSIKDTLMESEEYKGYGKLLYFRQGYVLLESKPFEKETETPTYEQAHLTVIRVCSPLFETQEKLKVGSTYAELSRTYPDSLIEVQPGAEQGTLELKIPKVSRLNFVLNQMGTSGADTPGSESMSPADIPPDAVISCIVVQP